VFRVRWVLVALVVVLVALASQFTVSPAQADTAADLAAARQKVADAQAEANALAAGMSEAQGRYEELDAKIRDWRQ
jgi:peptidoglycan hydrolase CwlO-like protein